MPKRLLIYILVTLPFLSFAQSDAPFVWADSVSDKRQEWVYFRKEIFLKALPQKAELNLFADSRYLLKINGISIGTGPVRFYPERVFFDTYDLTKLLKKGKNIISLKVLSHGMHTFQTPKSIGGLKVWGEVKEGKSTISLAAPNGWLCRRDRSHDLQTPKMTFALGPMEVADSRLEPDEWFGKSINTKHWKTPVLLQNQTHWAQLKARPVPFLNQTIINPKKLLGVYPLLDNEAVYSFRIKTNDVIRSETAKKYPALAYTYLYSPQAQKVKVGLWWGKYFLNGKEIIPLGASKTRMQWQDFELDLQEGWNYFLVKGESFWGIWDFYMSVPKVAQVELSAIKKKGSEAIFRTALFEPNQTEITNNYPVNLPNESTENWQNQARSNTANNPVFEMAWQQLGKALPNQNSSDSLVINTNQALVIDMGGKQLGRIRIEYEAPAGTLLDLGFSEDLIDQRAYVLKRTQMYLGSRHISNGKRTVFETFHPYGLRYLQINIKGKEKQPVKIHSVAMISETYPFEKIGSFACSDTLLTQIWEMGWRTLQVCSEDTYIDTPFRERGVYAGDALPEYALTLATTNDSRLMKHSLLTLMGLYRHLFQKGYKEHPDGMFGNLEDYPHLLIQSFHWYAQRTQDMDFVRQFYPNFKYFLDNVLAKQNPDGTYTNRDPAFIEWSAIEKRNAEHTFLHVQIAESCRLMASWATRFGYDNDNQRYSEEYQRLKALIQVKFWDETLGTYHDGFKGGKKIGTAYPISGAVVALYGIATTEQEAQIVKYLESQLADIGTESRKQKASTYGSFYILQALYKNQRADVAERFIKKHWRPMIAKHNDTAWENLDDVGIGTLSHAWSAHPTYFMSTEALGVQMEYPHRGSVLDDLVLAPQSETLTWAKGSVWHPKGTITIDWKIEGNQLIFNYQAPHDLKITVQPKGKLSRLERWVNGAKVI
jgi:alpha-L-rhamnosidase